MFKDVMYCMSCGHTFFYTHCGHNYRTENITVNCPKCMCMHTIDIDEILEKNNMKKGRYDGKFLKMLRKKQFEFRHTKIKKDSSIFYNRKELKCF